MNSSPGIPKSGRTGPLFRPFVEGEGNLGRFEELLLFSLFDFHFTEHGGALKIVLFRCPEIVLGQAKVFDDIQIWILQLEIGTVGLFQIFDFRKVVFEERTIKTKTLAAFHKGEKL